MNIDIDIDNKIPSDDICQQTAREGEQAPRRPTTPRTPDHFEDRARMSFRTSLNARQQQANCREEQHLLCMKTPRGTFQANFATPN